MKLNQTSHVHKLIRKTCRQIELLTNMQLVTDLSEEFDQIRFINKLGYIMIDYKKETCFVLGIKISKIEWQLVQDIMIYCNWLETGNNLQKGGAKYGIIRQDFGQNIGKGSQQASGTK